MVSLSLFALLSLGTLALAADHEQTQQKRAVDAPAQLHNFRIGVVQHLPPSKRARAFSSGVTHDPRSHRIRAADDEAAAADDLDLAALAVNTTLTRAERIAAIQNATLAGDGVSNSTTTARTVVPLTRNVTTSTGSSSRPTGVSSATSTDGTISSSTTITASPASPSSSPANATSSASDSDSASDSTASARSNATAASAASAASESSSERSVSSSIRYAAITSMLGAIFDTTTASATPSAAAANSSSTVTSDAEVTTTALLPTASSNGTTAARQAISRSEIPTETSISAEAVQVSRGGIVPSSTVDLSTVSATALPSLPLNASSLVLPLSTSTPPRSPSPVDTAAARESSIASILSDLFTLTATATATPTVSASDSQITASQRNSSVSRGSVVGEEVTTVAASVSSAIASAVSSIAVASANSTREPGVLPSLSSVLSAILSSATAIATETEVVSRGGQDGTAPLPTPTRLIPNPANQTADVSTLTPTATGTDSALFPGETGLLTRLPVNGSSTETIVTSPRVLPTTTPSANATQIVGSAVSSVVPASQASPSPTSTGESSAANFTESATSSRPTASINSANAWIPTSALIINTPSSSASTSATTTAFVAGATTTTNVNGKPSITITSQVAFPTNLPTKIVPSAAVAELQPVDTTLISILFNQQLSWTWLVSNGNASAQVFAYTPATLADALGVSADQIQTVSLEAFQPATFNGDTDSILTVYLAYIPSNYVDALQAMLKNPNSPLYQQSGVQSQIASLMNPNFSVLAYSGPNAQADGDSPSLSSTGGSSSTTSSGTSSTTIIIAVVVSFGVVMLSLAAFAAYRASTRNAVALPGSRNNERNGGGRSREPSGLRSFQLGPSEHGHNGLARSNSASTTSSASSGSTGYSGSRNGAPTSRGQAESASSGGDSWWRFSSDGGHGPPQGEMREQHRRINVVRAANGQFDSSTIGRPTIVSNSLML